MTTILNAQSGVGLTQSADGSGVLKVQSNGVTTNALAWVNFNGTGTVAIRSSYNVSSITDGGTGVYTVNFTTALSDENFSGVFTSNAHLSLSNTRTTTSLNVITKNYLNAAEDASMCNVAIFGN